jgi:hypothetical protein
VSCRPQVHKLKERIASLIGRKWANAVVGSGHDHEQAAQSPRATPDT